MKKIEDKINVIDKEKYVGKFSKKELGELLLKTQVALDVFINVEHYGDFEKELIGETYGLTEKEASDIWEILRYIENIME